MSLAHASTADNIGFYRTNANFPAYKSLNCEGLVLRASELTKYGCMNKTQS